MEIEGIRWLRFPGYKPYKAGRYLVTYKRSRAGRFVDIRRWDGEVWEGNADVTAWAALPERYIDGEKRRK